MSVSQVIQAISANPAHNPVVFKTRAWTNCVLVWIEATRLGLLLPSRLYKSATNWLAQHEPPVNTVQCTHYSTPMYICML